MSFTSVLTSSAFGTSSAALDGGGRERERGRGGGGGGECILCTTGKRRKMYGNTGRFVKFHANFAKPSYGCSQIVHWVSMGHMSVGAASHDLELSPLTC